jgi:tRNA pseudouridine38-40 synthase
MTLFERNIRLAIAYDGTAYVGWQIQPNGISVQQVVQDAIRKVTNEATNLIASSRTDSGVHALGQVANFQTSCTIPTEKFREAIQSALPEDISILSSDEVPAEFHSTYSAVRKTYRYLIHRSEVAVPFLRHYAWRIRHELDVEAMRTAAAHIRGTHDFRCFESQFPNKATSVRTVERILWKEIPLCEAWQGFGCSPVGSNQDCDSFLCLEITADGFLYNMVRAIVGTAVDVGRGRFAADDVKRMIDEGDRSLAGPTAPPQGLYLVGVEYDLNNLRPKHADDSSETVI